MTNNQILVGDRKYNLLLEAVDEHPSFLVRRCVFENIPLKIDEVDAYLENKALKGDNVDRIWLLKQLVDAALLDEPYHLIKKILNQ